MTDFLGLVRKPFSVAIDLLSARVKPGLAAAGDDSALKRRIKSLMETGGLDYKTARRLAVQESFRDTMQEGVDRVLDAAEKESISPDDFAERMSGGLQERGSVSMHALDASRYTTADELRSLLGKILAKDVDKRGSIHPSTVECVKKLDADALRSLIRLRVIAWTYADAPDKLPFLATPVNAPVNIDLSQHSRLIRYAGLTHDEYLRLENLGIIYPKLNLVHNIEVSDGDVEYDEDGKLLRPKTIRLRNGQRTVVFGTTETRPLHLGSRHLTTEGAEILGLYLDEPYAPKIGYFEDMCEFWKSGGFLISADPQNPQDPFTE